MILNQYHMCRNSVFYSVDDTRYEEEYLLFGYSISIAEERSNHDKLYVYYDIQDESDMYLLSYLNMNPSKNIIILVYQILFIQLESLVLRMQTLLFFDTMFLVLSLPAARRL